MPKKHPERNAESPVEWTPLPELVERLNRAEHIEPKSPAVRPDVDLMWKLVSGAEPSPRFVLFAVDLDRPTEAVGELRRLVKMFAQYRPKAKGGAPRFFPDWVSEMHNQYRLGRMIEAALVAWPEIQKIPQAEFKRRQEILFDALLPVAGLPEKALRRGVNRANPKRRRAQTWVEDVLAEALGCDLRIVQRLRRKRR